MLREIWLDYAGDNHSHLRIVRVACIIITGFFAALCGKADLRAVIKHWNKSMKNPNRPHVAYVIRAFQRGGGEKDILPTSVVCKKEHTKLLNVVH